MIDRTSEFGQRAERRLNEERVAWMTTVTRRGTPQPTPVWFLYYGDPGRERILVYSLNTSRRNDNVQANPRVALNLACTDDGSDVVIVNGTARIAPELPAPRENAPYLVRYGEWIVKDWGTPEKFADEYGTPIEITDLKVHGW